jgi:hypothetical protein
MARRPAEVGGRSATPKGCGSLDPSERLLPVAERDAARRRGQGGAALGVRRARAAFRLARSHIAGLERR